MKKLLVLCAIFALLVTACGNEAHAAPTDEGVAISDVYTAAAMTIAAQASMTTPTAFATPTSVPVTVTASQVYIPSTSTQNSAVSYLSYSTAYGCYDAVYISDVTVPDGTVLAPGEEFVKTWKFQNTGSCDWAEDFWITFSSGEDMDGDDTEIDKVVTFGDSASISVSLIAPDDEGTYTGYWKLATEDGTVFGETVYVLIVVSDDASTSTPTATATMANTETATTTTEITATTVPTSTYTPVPTSTYTPVPEGEVMEESDTNSGKGG